MITYNLIQTPNQIFNVSPTDGDYEITIRSFRGYMYASIYRDGSVLSAGNRIISNMSIFPSAVCREVGGEFKVMCNTKDVPTYSDFDGITAKFVFIPFNK